MHLRVKPERMDRRQGRRSTGKKAPNLVHSILELEGLVRFFLHHQEARRSL